MNRVRSLAVILAVLSVLVAGLLVFIGSASGNAPSIVSVSFPSHLPLRGTGSGSVTFKDPDGDVSLVRFNLVDGRFNPFKFDPYISGLKEGSFNFQITCTHYAQQIILKVTLFDRAGNSSNSVGFSFTCGSPPEFNYDQEQATVRETTLKATLNVFILSDGVTTLTENAAFKDPEAALGEPDPVLKGAIERQIVPGLTGIWDQCAVALELGLVKVVRPEKIVLASGTLESALFSLKGGERVVFRGRRTGDALREAIEPLNRELQKENKQILPGQLNAFVVGSRILYSETEPRDIYGFADVGTPISLVRWDSILVIDPSIGLIFTPKLFIRTLAHEIGHNFGLLHNDEDGLAETSADPMNLMEGKAFCVLPNPRVNLVPIQCKIVAFGFAPSPKTIRVPDDLPNLRTAIPVARNGDTVAVSAGTYRENLVISERSITLQGAGRDSVIIDGSGKPDSVTIMIHNARDVVVRGFTITGGKGGIAVQNNSRATIANNTISLNRQYGIALFRNSSAEITGNIITNNGGWGIYADATSTVTLCSSNVISGHKKNLSDNLIGKCK